MATQTSAPLLDGLTLVQPIGTGGFADVYLYQQAFPSRRVAVKVLREKTDAAVLEMFTAEANVMAQLAGHPSIVPILQAGVSGDGRAHLVMEYCPGPHLADRFRVERIAVPEVLEVAVKIASAVETAHRAGILHRDIKPHNILTSAYGAPLLTDFGIASVADGAGPSYGMSIPWSPPEAFNDDAPPDVRSDVYSLAATVYSLLAGRSPFEIPGAANDSATLIHRIEHQEPSAILRADVPEGLNQLLRRSLSRRPGDRPASGMAFARGIQEVQIALDLAPTRLEVMDASPVSAGESPRVVEDARTEVKPISIIIPDAIAERGTLLRPTSITRADDRTGLHPRRALPAADTLHSRAPSPVDGADGVVPLQSGLTPGPAETLDGPRQRRWPVVVGTLAGLAVVGVVVAALLGSTPQSPSEDAPAPPSAPPGELVLGGPAAPVDLTVTRRGGEVVVGWTNPDPGPDDTFRVETGSSLTGLVELTQGPDLAAAVPAEPGSQLCVAITTIRTGAASEPLEDCVVVP